MLWAADSFLGSAANDYELFLSQRARCFYATQVDQVCEVQHIKVCCLLTTVLCTVINIH